MKSPNNSDIPDVFISYNSDNGLRSSEANLVKTKLLKKEPIKKNFNCHAYVLKIKESYWNMIRIMKMIDVNLMIETIVFAYNHLYVLFYY
jgi:hypothetical protein